MSKITTISYEQLMNSDEILPLYVFEFFYKTGINTNYVNTVPNFIKEYRNRVSHLSDIMWLLVRKMFMSEKQIQLFAILDNKKTTLNELVDYLLDLFERGANFD